MAGEVVVEEGVYDVAMGEMGLNLFVPIGNLAAHI